MNKKVLLFLFLLSYLFNPNSWGMDEQQNNQEDDVTKITRLLRAVEEKIPKIYEEGTIFLGNTSSGKSTLFNYVQGAPLHGKFKGVGRSEIVFAPGVNTENYSPIGIQLTVSQTTFPVVVDSNFDCPGFKDTRHLQDIINAYSIYRIVSRTKKLKILLVSNIGEITDARSTLFLDLIDQVGEIFKNDIEALCKGLCLVVTKTNRQQVNKEEYKTLFVKMLEEQRKEKPEKETRLKILKFLSQSDRIGFFKMPEAEGLIPNDDKQGITEMLHNTPYQGNIKPTLSLSDRSKLAVRTLISGIFDKMRDVILDLSAKYPAYYENFITSNIDKTASELREALKKIATHLGTVSNETDNFYEDAKKISSVLEILSHGSREVFAGYRERLAFFKQVGLAEFIEDEIGKYRIFSSLITFPKDAENFTKVELSENNSRITGFLLGTSDINRLLAEQALSAVDLYSLNTLLIDEEIMHPGLKLTLISPHWWVIGNKKISLKGGTGISHDSVKARDGNTTGAFHGEDGLPGKPGQNGGHFYGKGKVFRGLEKLTIDVSGGKGGLGQHGGDGANGVDGIRGNKKDVVSRKKDCLSQKTSLKTISYALPILTCGNLGTFEEYQSGVPGKKGGNGGKGGRGGNGGKGGRVVFESGAHDPIQVKDTAGENGDNGTSGAPGKGGKHQPIYVGAYVDIEMFGAHKLIMKEVINTTIGAETKYGFCAKLLKKIIGCGGCMDCARYGIKGGVVAVEIGYEMLKSYSFYLVGGPYLVTAEFLFSTIHLAIDNWYIKPHEKNIGDAAPNGNIPISYNVDGLELADTIKDPINIAEKIDGFNWLRDKYRRSELAIALDF